MKEIEEAINYHLEYKSGIIKCIIVSNSIFKELEKQLENVSNFKFDKTYVMKYKGIDFYVAENLTGKIIKTY